LKSPFIINHANFTNLKLLDEKNVFHNNAHISEAKQMAKDVGLDLVCFSEPSGNELAFCKILDYGKWKYTEEKKNKKLKKESKKQSKEIRFSPLIDDGDIGHKIKRAEGFLDQNLDVVFAMRLKGRQRGRFKEAEEKLNSIIAMCENAEEVSRRKNGNGIIVRLTKNKTGGKT